MHSWNKSRNLLLVVPVICIRILPSRVLSRLEPCLSTQTTTTPRQRREPRRQILSSTPFLRLSVHILRASRQYRRSDPVAPADGQEHPAKNINRQSRSVDRTVQNGVKDQTAAEFVLVVEVYLVNLPSTDCSEHADNRLFTRPLSSGNTSCPSMCLVSSQQRNKRDEEQVSVVRLSVP